jgi:DNA-binding response OmpR family regulator
MSDITSLNNRDEKAKVILVVEDEDTLREMIVEFLESSDFQTLSAKNGEAAIDVLNSHRVDMAIVDVRMPKIDGLKLLKIIKSARKCFPVILMTGFKIDEEKLKILPYPADFYLTKPFDLMVLLNAIGDIFQRLKSN